MLSIETARAWYPSADPVHGFDHVLRVYRLAAKIAQAEGADLEIVQAAALLHDVNGSQIHIQESARSAHHHAAAEFARQTLAGEGWEAARIAAVQHCIRAHRFRHTEEAPQTLEAQALFDADKLDAIGAIGIARAIGYALQAGQPAYARPSTHFLRTGETEPGEAHSAYHEYLFKLRHIAGRLYTSTGKRFAAARHRLMEEFFQALEEETSAS